MTNPWLYSDGVLTAREVMTTPDGARLAWRAAWRFVRRERRNERGTSTRTSFLKMENRVAVMLIQHHAVSPMRAYAMAGHISALRELRSIDRAVACSDHTWQLLREAIRLDRLQPSKFRTGAKY